MELRHLQVLIAVAEQGSFSAAADQLGTVQSNVSAHMAKLEKELATTLVERSTGHLTEEGELALARAYRVLSELEALTDDVSALRAEVTGTVRLGMLGTTARWLVPALLTDLAGSHPRLRLVVTEGSTSGLEPQLASGRVELAVITHPVPGRDLLSEPLFEEQIVLAVRTDRDPTDGRTAITLAELSSMELLIPVEGSAFRSEIDSATKAAGIQLRPIIEVDGVRLLASLAFDGHGPALLPATAVPEFLRSQVRLVTVHGMAWRRVGLAVRSRGLPSAPTRVVASALRRAADPARLPEGLRPDRELNLPVSEGAPRGLGPTG